MLELKAASYRYDGQTGLKPVNLKLPGQQITTIVGPNGAGKSTLLKLLSAALKPQTGQLLIDGVAAEALTPKKRAQKLAILHQENQLYDEVTVKQLLSWGQLPYHSFWDAPTSIDADVVKLLNLRELLPRPLSQLSGGQKQRVWLGLALNQQTPYLFLDEPTAYLDLHYQMQLLRLLPQLVAQRQMTICLVLHDLNQALQISDYCCLLSQGQIARKGSAQQVLQPPAIKTYFKINCDLVKTSHGSYLLQY
jgi:iron complex transport system ATP-binding protein